MPNKQWGRGEPGGGGQNKRGKGVEDFSNERGVVGIFKSPLTSVTNEKRDKCLVLILNLKVSKQTRSEASKNKVIIKSVPNISIN